MEQPVITINEAAAMYHIGQKKLRYLVKISPHADWIWNNGRYNYIRKDKFEKYLEDKTSINEII